MFPSSSVNHSYRTLAGDPSRAFHHSVIGSFSYNDVVVPGVVADLHDGCRDISEFSGCSDEFRTVGCGNAVGHHSLKLSDPQPQCMIVQGQFIVPLFQREIMPDVLGCTPYCSAEVLCSF